MPNLFTMVLPYLLEMLLAYIKSSDTTQDDKVLKIVQEGARYLAPCPNNSLQYFEADKIANATMTTKSIDIVLPSFDNDDGLADWGE